MSNVSITMELAGQHRKRKSRDSDIFEVSEKDLSPEPEEKIENEPESKVLKSTETDVTDSRQKNEQPNLEDSDKTSRELNTYNEVDITVSNQGLKGDIEEILVGSTKIFDDSRVQEALEDGEVNDSIQNNTILVATPCISITFANKEIAEVYKHKFCKFVESFVELEISLENDTTVNILKNPKLNPSEWSVLDNTIDITGTNESNQDMVDVAVETARKQKKKKKQDLFIVDTTRRININEIKLKYSTKFVINDGLEEKNKIPAPQTICFNCEKQHALVECPEPKNFSKISINRQKFNAKSKVARYHLETDQKYGHLKPGKISPELRKALGLKKHQIPSYIYLMRCQGYPPGWLEEAKFMQSELNMFDIDGNSVKNTVKSKTKGLDPEKVVDYPGFNVPFDKGYRDEYDLHNVPPYSDSYSKEKMLQYFEEHCMKEDDFQAQDMDLDDINDLSEEEITERSLELPYLPKEGDTNDVPSPSLVDLEREKKTLLAELQKSADVVPWDFEGPDDSNSISDDSAKPQNADADTKTEPIEDNRKENQDRNYLNGNASVEAPNKFKSFVSVNNTMKSIKNSTYGTPILKSNSPYDKLPQLTNFTKGVSAVIDFENLPNSTGKYEQMSKVLQKVRDKLKVNNKL